MTVFGKRLYKCDKIKTVFAGLAWFLNPVTSVLIHKKKKSNVKIHRHLEGIPCAGDADGC